MEVNHRVFSPISNRNNTELDSFEDRRKRVRRRSKKAKSFKCNCKKSRCLKLYVFGVFAVSSAYHHESMDAIYNVLIQPLSIGTASASRLFRCAATVTASIARTLRNSQASANKPSPGLAIGTRTRSASRKVANTPTSKVVTARNLTAKRGGSPCLILSLP